MLTQALLINKIMETKQCQNCHEDFIIESDDFAFYKKMQVPAPTWCWECQMMCRLAFRNERMIYKRKESLGGKEVISIFSQDKPITVYSQEYWQTDKWDPMQYGQDYDFSRSFFEQFGELVKRVPWLSLFNWNNVNSEYCNMTTDNKNCYLVFGGDFNEDSAYSTFNFHSKNVMDVYWMNKGELSYEVVDTSGVYKVFFSQYARDTTDSAFIYNGAGLNNCLGCINLRNKSNAIFNEQYSKEDYAKKKEEFDLGSYSKLEEFKKKFKEFRLKFPHRYAEIVKSVGSTGNNIHNAKNAQNCFDIDEAEDIKNIFLAGWGLKDARNCNHLGHKSELVYDSVAIFSNTSRIKHSWITSASHDMTYCFNCRGSSNLFGCVGLKNKSYCIFNKQYSKEEYEDIVPKIIQQMNEVPYLDKKGRTYKYGDFPPAELSLFAYNETVAQEYFPLTKEEALEQGYSWKDPEPRNYQITLKNKDIPDHIKDVPDSILNEIIECAHNVESNVESSTFNNTLGCPTTKCNEQCTQAFRIIPSELDFLRKQNLPLPRLCPNCRHYQRIKQRRPLKLWKRPCQCAGLKSANNVYENSVGHEHGGNPCPNKFDTAFAPERPEIVYCELCYLKEVV